jgi:alpha/beta hydrolase family protein DUF900
LIRPRAEQADLHLKNLQVGIPSPKVECVGNVINAGWQRYDEIVQTAGARAVHIIAHSMGNRGVMRAINRIAAKAEQQSRVRFEQIILAAPDIDADVFRELCGAYASVSKRTTLYVCGKDRAIEASSWLHQFPRVGLTPPICVVHGIDTINVTNVILPFWGTVMSRKQGTYCETCMT